MTPELTVSEIFDFKVKTIACNIRNLEAGGAALLSMHISPYADCVRLKLPHLLRSAPCLLCFMPKFSEVLAHLSKRCAIQSKTKNGSKA